MGRQVGHVHEPRLRSLLAQVLDHGVGEEGDGAVLGRPGHRGGADRLARSAVVVPRRKQQGRVVRHFVAAAREMPAPGPVVAVHPNHGGHAGQHAGVRAQSRIAGGSGPWIHARIGIAEEDRFVAELARLERDVGVARVERRAVGHDAVVVQVEAGIEARPARAAGRRLRVVAREQHARLGEAVEVRGTHARMSERGEAVAPPLVGGYEEHVQQGLSSYECR